MINNSLLGIFLGVLIYYLVFHNKTNKQNKYPPEPKLKYVDETTQNINDPIILSKYAQAKLENNTFSKVILGYIENGRNNNNFGKYPPCFDMSLEARQLFDIFEANNLIVQHKVLFEVLSIILCHIKSNNSNQCINNQINIRINDFGNLGFKRNDQTFNDLIQKILGEKYNQNSPFVNEFLLRATTLIENEIGKINLESNKIRSLVNLFYQNTYLVINC